MNPTRGDVWLVDLGSVAKVRPCLVVSIPALDRDRALTTLIRPPAKVLKRSKEPIAVAIFS